MEIDELVSRLGRLSGAVVGRGPRHPELPDRSIGSKVDSFLESYPTLLQDRCYVDFLEKYAGFKIENEDYTTLVNVFGFSDVSLDPVDADGPDVYDGFLQFAQGVYQVDPKDVDSSYEYDFAFDVSGARPPGVYVCVSTMANQSDVFTWYVDDFCVWLDDLIRRGGVYAQPSAD